MSTTPNLGLTITPNSEWSTKKYGDFINDEAANMEKIDEAIGAIHEAIDGVSTDSVVEQNNGLPQKFWRGTQAEYDAIETKSEDTMYIITDGGGESVDPGDTIYVSSEEPADESIMFWIDTDDNSGASGAGVYVSDTEPTGGETVWIDTGTENTTGYVNSFNGRTGDVVPASGDYTAEMVGSYSQERVDELLAQKQAAINTLVAELQRRPNHNLLDNWYFVNPVNQRGQTEYTAAGYTVDRWTLLGSGSVVTASDGVQLSFGATTSQFVQYIENGDQLFGKTVTISAIINGTLNSKSITIPETPSAGTIGSAVDFADGIYCYLRYTTTGLLYFSFYATSLYSPGTVVNIKAAKLELGSEQTIAHQDENANWVLNEIPDYGEQLAKCQRYQVILDYTSEYAVVGFGIGASETYIRCMIPTPVTLRANPQFSNTLTEFTAVGCGKAIGLLSTTPSGLRNKPNAVLVSFPDLSGVSANETYLLQVYGGCIIFDANL